MKNALFLVLFFSLLSTAQTEQAWIFFTAKENVETLLTTPEQFLSTRAIERKEKYNITIDERDIPISEDYIDTITNIDALTFLATSKWLNAVYVEGSYDTIVNLVDLDFVQSVFFMDRSLNTSEKTSILTQAKSFSVNKFEEVVAFDYGFTTTQVEQINIDTLHDLGYTGAGILIGVMDSGFINVDTISAFDRAWENNQIVYGYDVEFDTEISFDESQDSHGTNVLSTMLGYVEGAFVGTAIDAQYALFKTEVVSSETPQEEAFWIAAAEKADSLGVDVINTSLGYSTFDDSKYDYATTDMDGETTFISQAAAIALEKGMLPVISAGNSGNSSWGIITAPADSASVLSIGAIDADGNKAGFSSTGPTADGRIKPDVVALGSDSIVINQNGEISSANGTSFSSPIMAGAIACLWQAFPESNATEIMEMVKMSGHLYNNPNTDLGYGIPDFSTYFDSTLSIDTEYLKIKNKIVVGELEFLFPNDNQSYVYYIYNMAGQIVKFGNVEPLSSINIDELPTGLYFFKADDNEAQKFIKL